VGVPQRQRAHDQRKRFFNSFVIVGANFAQRGSHGVVSDSLCKIHPVALS